MCQHCKAEIARLDNWRDWCCCRYTTDEGLCLQDDITISLGESDSMPGGQLEPPTLVTYTPSQVVEELDLNTPLVSNLSEASSLNY